MNKIMFIDIDGPLVPFRATFLPENLSHAYGWRFDQCAVGLLNFLGFSIPNLRAVISSHRVFDERVNAPGILSKNTRVFWEAIFEENGLEIVLHDQWVTPRQGWRTKEIEIREWLSKHSGSVSHFATFEDELCGMCEIEEQNRAEFHLCGEDYENGIGFGDLVKAWIYLGMDAESIFDKYKEYKQYHLELSNESVTSNILRSSVSIGNSSAGQSCPRMATRRNR